MVEKTELFCRSIGETTDIVEKEMYTFTDKGGTSLTLRPEGTAPVMRAFIEHKLHAQDPVAKLYYMGPMFRYERPQKGRYRQFHQIGAEVIGVDDPEDRRPGAGHAEPLFRRRRHRGCRSCRSTPSAAPNAARPTAGS